MEQKKWGAGNEDKQVGQSKKVLEMANQEGTYGTTGGAIGDHCPRQSILEYFRKAWRPVGWDLISEGGHMIENELNKNRGSGEVQRAVRGDAVLPRGMKPREPKESTTGSDVGFQRTVLTNTLNTD